LLLVFRKLIHEFISVFSYKLISSQFDLGVQFRLRATKETLDYIQKNMSGAIMFLSTEKIFGYLIPKTKKNGSFLEFGVWKGKSITITSKLVGGEGSRKIVHGFDSFEGLPEDWFGYDDVKGGFNLDGKLPEVPKNVKLYKGWFHETLPKFLVENNESVSFLHIDSDLYSSAKTVLNLLRERIVVNTIIVFDQYFNYPNWQKGEFKAFQEFVKENNIRYEYMGFTNDKATAVRVIQKNKN